MKSILTVVLAAFLAACSANGQDGYDLVILNGRVMDPETEFDAIRNVGIKDGRIATITEEEITEYTEDVLEHIQILARAFGRMSQTG